MKNKLKFAILFLFLAGALIPTQASAYGLHFCNKTSASIDVAVGIFSDSPSSPQDSGEEDIILGTGSIYARTMGWWTIAPGQCSTPMSQPLQKSSSYYYWADDSNGKSWNGDQSMCVVFGHVFNFNMTHDALNCSDDRKRQFNKIDTQSYSDYTYTFYP